MYHTHFLPLTSYNNSNIIIIIHRLACLVGSYPLPITPLKCLQNLQNHHQNEGTNAWTGWPRSRARKRPTQPQVLTTYLQVLNVLRPMGWDIPPRVRFTKNCMTLNPRFRPEIPWCLRVYSIIGKKRAKSSNGWMNPNRSMWIPYW